MRIALDARACRCKMRSNTLHYNIHINGCNEFTLCAALKRIKLAEPKAHIPTRLHTHARTIGKHTISVRRFRSIFANSIAFPFSIAIAATRVSLSSCSWPMLPISFAHFAIVHRSTCVADFLAQKPIYFDSLANTCFDVQSIISHDPHARRRERNK